MIFYCLFKQMPAFNEIRICPVFFDVIFCILITLLDLDVYNIHRTIIAQRKRRNHTSDRFLRVKEVAHAKGKNDCPRTGSRGWLSLGVYSLALEIGGITGRVWNNDDGTVGILAQAESSSQMAKFIQEIRKGPTPFACDLFRCYARKL